VRRRLAVLALVLATSVVLPAAAFAHEAPETKQSRWVMADWMLDTFFIFAGLALAAFLWAWKAGHFQNLELHARIPLGIHEEDYYTPEWALDEEEWDDVHAER
jgi:protein-S-isoprenylcysteine O-methyltransferase Ste14